MKRLILIALFALILPSTNASAQFSIGEISILRSLTTRLCTNGQIPAWDVATQRWICGSGGGGGGAIQDAVADGLTKGLAAFVAADFNSSSGIISIDYTNAQSASGSTKGFLTSTDWTTFNNKESALTFSAPLSRAVNTVSCPTASGSQAGCLSSADWTTFNNKGVGTITSVTATSPVTSTGGTTPVIACATCAVTSSSLAQFASTTSAQLATLISNETGSGLLVFGTSPTIVTPTIASFTNATHNHQDAAGGGTLDAAAVAAGTIAPARLGSGSGGATKFLREDSTFQTIGGGGDALVANPLSQFAATTSAQLAGVISDESGSGLVILQTSPTIITPTIASFTNATHNHTNAAGGGQLTDAALSSAVTVPKGGSGATTLTGLLLGNGASAFTAVTTSAGISGALSDETGSGALVFGTSPTIVTPTIASFANANHNHTDSAGGGQIPGNALSSYIPNLVTMATLPGSPTAGQVVTVTDGATSGQCEPSGVTTGSFQTLCRRNAITAHWEPVVPIGAASSLQAAKDVGASITNAVDASTAVKIGNGTINWIRYCDSSNVCHDTTDLPSDTVFKLFSGKRFSVTNSADVEVASIDEATGRPAGFAAGAAFGSENGGSNITCSGGGGDTTYLTVFGNTLSSTESIVRHPSSVTGLLGNLYIAIPSAVPASQTVTVTAMIANSASTVTCAVTATGVACNDTTHTAAVAIGNNLSLRINCAGGTTAIATLRAGFRIQ